MQQLQTFLQCISRINPAQPNSNTRETSLHYLTGRKPAKVLNVERDGSQDVKYFKDIGALPLGNGGNHPLFKVVKAWYAFIQN